jgi:IS1 family transposase
MSKCGSCLAVVFSAMRLWTFVGKKARHIRKGDSPEHGDAWIFVALDAATKLVPGYVVGKRSNENTQTFIHDVSRTGWEFGHNSPIRF